MILYVFMDKLISPDKYQNIQKQSKTSFWLFIGLFLNGFVYKVVMFVVCDTNGYGFSQLIATASTGQATSPTATLSASSSRSWTIWASPPPTISCAHRFSAVQGVMCQKSGGWAVLVLKCNTSWNPKQNLPLQWQILDCPIIKCPLRAAPFPIAGDAENRLVKPLNIPQERTSESAPTFAGGPVEGFKMLQVRCFFNHTWDGFWLTNTIGMGYKSWSITVVFELRNNME